MTSAALSTVAEAVTGALAPTIKKAAHSHVSTKTGVVVSAGLAANTVKVQVGGEVWNKKVRKYFKVPQRHLVHDPNNSLRTGDIVEIVSGWRTSRWKRFVVTRIIAPFGPPIEERPPVPTEEERIAAHDAKRERKLARKKLRENVQLFQKRTDKATSITDEITRLAWQLKLTDKANWTERTSSAAMSKNKS